MNDEPIATIIKTADAMDNPLIIPKSLFMNRQMMARIMQKSNNNPTATINDLNSIEEPAPTAKV